MTRNKLIGLVTAGILATTMTGLAPAANAATLTGAGSTLVSQLMAKWTADYKATYGVQVNYGAVGSGAGISNITARSVDFGASDAPMTAAQAAACNNCILIPWGLSAIGITYNIPGIRVVTLSGPVIGNIYLGRVKFWDDASIKRLNPRTHLPHLAITPVFRSDGSGTTFGFTNYLSQVMPPWARIVGNATKVNFPVGVGGKGSAGVTAIVGSTVGSIGYVETSFAITHGLTVAGVLNKARKVIYPNLKNIAAAASSVRSVPAESVLETSGLSIVDPPASNKIAYPISTFTYAIVPQSSPQASLVTSFVNYAVTVGQAFGPVLDFQPLPKVVANYAIAQLGSIH